MVTITFKKSDNKKEQKEYRFLNKIYKLSQKGKLTSQRIKWEKSEKIALTFFLTALIVSAFLFAYMFFVSWAERAFAKKNFNLQNNQTSVEIVAEPTQTNSEPTASSTSVVQPATETSNVNVETNTSNTGKLVEVIPASPIVYNPQIGETSTITQMPETNSQVSKAENGTQEVQKTDSTPDSTGVSYAQATDKETTNPESTDSSSLSQGQVAEVPRNEEPIIASINELAFVNNGGISLFDSPETKKEIGRVRYGTYVRVIKQKEVSGVNYSYVVYYDRKDLDNVRKGWLRTSHLTFVSKYVSSKSSNTLMEETKKITARVKNVRGIYLSRSTASSRKNLDWYLQFAKRNNLNAFVIDVKDDDGLMLFQSEVSTKYSPNSNRFAVYTKEEMKEITKKLKSEGIYLIARIVCFKDPTYAKAHMNKAIVYKDTGEPYMGVYKVPWASAYDRELWEYNIEVAKETAEVGFDEIQYDYVRFIELPKAIKDRVNLRQVGNETMAEAIHQFLVRSKKELEPYGVPLAADIFGLVSSVVDDLGIGQNWEMISSATDYVCPMVYPSHYANGSFGLSVPDAYPYETAYNSVLDGVIRNKYLPSPARIRPWIQSFTATWVKGHIKYGEEEIRKQIKALKDLGINEYMLWNASNKYIEMRYE